MFISSNFLKNSILNSSIAERGRNILFSKLKQNVKFRNMISLNFFNKTMRTSTSKYLLVRRLCVVEKSSSYGYSSMQSVAFPKVENDVSVRSNFQEMMYARKMQAHRSILIEIAEKADIPFAVAYFEKYGSIANIYSYPGESGNYFLLLEFSSEAYAQNLLLNCGFQNIDDVYPVSSRILHYEKKSNTPANVNLNVNEESFSELSYKAGTSISEVIKNTYLNERLTELDIRLRFFLCSLMKDSISGLFPHCDVLPFGSSVNGVGKRGCDLDIVIRLYPEKLNGDGEVYFLSKTCVGKQKHLQQKTLFRLGEYLLFSPGVSLCDRIMFARVPILKMKHTILNMDFDVSVNNMSAVLMSDMLHFCGEIDSRVRPLVHVVKKWAKESNITKQEAGCQITNFGLTNLVLFFLQSRKPHPILPPLNDAFIIQGSDNCYGFGLQYLKSIEYWKNYASLNKESLAMLLKEFLVYLSSYPFHEKILSLLSGEIRTRDETSMPLYVEYPLDESLNITKNVTKAEYDTMIEKARISAKYLENNLNQTVKNEKDFSVLLGIPSVSRIGIKSDKFNVKSILENDKNSWKKKMKYKT